MKSRALFGGLLSVWAMSLGACTYNVPVAASPNLNVYSSFGDKLAGSYALYVDSETFSQTVHATGYSCSAHNYPIDMRDTFRQSVIATVQQLVEQVEVVPTPLTSEELARSGKRGQIIVHADAMTAHVEFIPGFWSATGESNVDMTASVTVDGASGRLLGTTGEGTGEAQHDAGVYCDGGATAIADAAQKATKQLLGQLGERLSNAPRLRALTEAPSDFHQAAVAEPTTPQPSIRPKCQGAGGVASATDPSALHAVGSQCP